MRRSNQTTPDPCLEHPGGQNPTTEQTHTDTERNRAYTRGVSVRGGYTRSARGGRAALLQCGGDGGPLGPSHLQLLFSISSQSRLGAATLESGEPVPALPSPIPFPEPRLPISHPVLLPQEAGGEVQKRVYAAQGTKLGRPRPEAVTVGGSG